MSDLIDAIRERRERVSSNYCDELEKRRRNIPADEAAECGRPRPTADWHEDALRDYQDEREN